MNIDVIMPKMGESITEGTILEWKKNIGDSIKQDETLLEISTDKVDSEIPSPAEGVLSEILYKVNDVVSVGEIIAKINTDSDATIKEEKVKTKNDEKVFISSNTVEQIESNENLLQNTSKSKRFFSPLVRSIAKKEGIKISELESLTGSGRNNRLNKNDILKYIESKNIAKPNPQLIDIPNIPSQNIQTTSISNKIEKMDRVRLKIGQHMVNSLKTSPHVYSTSEVDMTKIVTIRDKFKQAFLEEYDLKLTYTPFILNACIKAIKNFPLMNARIDGENIIHQKNINLGIAVALNNGNLIVPALKYSEEKNFLGLARNSYDLANKARMDNLLPDDIFGSTFTVTNPGSAYKTSDMPVITIDEPAPYNNIPF